MLGQSLDDGPGSALRDVAVPGEREGEPFALPNLMLALANRPGHGVVAFSDFLNLRHQLSPPRHPVPVQPSTRCGGSTASLQSDFRRSRLVEFRKALGVAQADAQLRQGDEGAFGEVGDYGGVDAEQEGGRGGEAEGSY